MKFTTVISKDTIAKCVENSYTSERVVLEESGESCVPTHNVCRGFVSKAIDYLIGFKSPAGNVQSVMLVDDLRECITLRNNKETAVLFETFKKLGINIGELRVGFDYAFENLYLSDKLIKDLKRYDGTETLSALLMYIMSLSYFCSNLFRYNSKFVVDEFANSILVCENFESFFYSFKDRDYYVNIQGIASEEFDIIGWHASPYADYTYNQFTDAPFKQNVIRTKNAMGVEETFLVCTMKLGSAVSCFQISDDGTNIELNYFELQNDSMVRAIMPRNFDTPTIRRELFIGTEWTTLDISDVPDIFKNTLCYLSMFIAMEEGLSKEELAPLGITIKGSNLSIDCTAMKEQYAEDEYARQLYGQAHAYYEDFDLGNLYNLVPGFAKGDVYAMLFTGDSGTGKSTSARVIPYKCGIPYVSVNFSVNIEESDLFGSMMPNPTKNDPSDPEFIWQDGVITKAVRNGYCAILEEINFARPGVLGKFNSLLDENRQIDLPNGEIVKAHPNFRMIATCNIAYEGTNKLNKAFINRFEQVVNFQNPDLDVLINIIKTRTGYSNDSNISKILDAYCAIRKYSNEQSLDAIISVRQLLTLFKQGKYYKTASEAVENIIVNGAFIDVPEHLEMFKKSILPALDLKFKI